MGFVIASIRIYPSSVDRDLKQLVADIAKGLPPYARLYSVKEEPIAFGLVALLVDLIIPEDVEGAMESVEETLKALRGVGEIQVISVSRAS